MSHTAPKASTTKEEAKPAKKAVFERALDTLIDQHGGSPLTKSVGRFALDALIGAIVEELKTGDSARVAGLGTFSVKSVSARTFFNPTTKTQEQCEATVRVAFRPTPSLRADVKAAHRAKPAPHSAKASPEKKKKVKAVK